MRLSLFALLTALLSPLVSSPSELSKTLSSPMPMKKGAYFEVSEENRERLMSGEEPLKEERERVLKALSNRLLPLKGLLAAAAAGGLFFLSVKAAPLFLARCRRWSRPSRTAGERALERLSRLERSDQETSLIELGSLLRRYFEERGLFPATRQTTSELLFSLDRCEGLPREAKVSLAELFSSLDAVNYGGRKLPPEQAKEALSFVKAFFEKAGKRP